MKQTRRQFVRTLGVGAAAVAVAPAVVAEALADKPVVYTTLGVFGYIEANHRDELRSYVPHLTDKEFEERLARYKLGMEEFYWQKTSVTREQLRAALHEVNNWNGEWI
jgi:hypothetical protein